MERVVGVRFQEAGKISYFSPQGFEDVEAGEYVVVETSRGLEVARVVVAPNHVVIAELTEPLKPLVRLADADDLERVERLKARADTEIEAVRAAVRVRDLPMKVVSAGYSLDGARLTVYFTSEGRVDFRDLLRDLGRQLGVQVQLRQVGPRDQARAADGYGRCGRRLCCSSWLTSFPAITIKMAKEQNLPLNPSKISGQCGRLLCCLAYEDDTYKQLKAQLPRPGTRVSTPSGDARVLAVNALRQVVTLQLETLQVVELPAAALGLERGVVRVIAGGEQTDVLVEAEAPPVPAPLPPPPAPARRPRERPAARLSDRERVKEPPDLPALHPRPGPPPPPPSQQSAAESLTAVIDDDEAADGRTEEAGADTNEGAAATAAAQRRRRHRRRRGGKKT